MAYRRQHYQTYSDYIPIEVYVRDDEGIETSEYAVNKDEWGHKILKLFDTPRELIFIIVACIITLLYIIYAIIFL